MDGDGFPVRDVQARRRSNPRRSADPLGPSASGAGADALGGALLDVLDDLDPLVVAVPLDPHEDSSTLERIDDLRQADLGVGGDAERKPELLGGRGAVADVVARAGAERVRPATPGVVEVSHEMRAIE